MRTPARLAPALSVPVLLLAASFAGAEVRLPALVGSHMVLQRDVPARVWGWAAPGETVTVALADGPPAAGHHRCRRQVDGRPAGAARRRSVHDDDRRGFEHDHARRRLVGRGVGRLRPVEHGVAPAAGHGRVRGRASRVRRPAALHRGEGDVARAQGGRERPVARVRRVLGRGVLGGGVLLRPGRPPRDLREGRPRAHVVGRHAGRGMDEPRRARERAVAAAARGRLRRRAPRPRRPRGLQGEARGVGEGQLPPGRVERRSEAGLAAAGRRHVGVVEDGPPAAVGEGRPRDRRRGVVPPHGRGPRRLGRPGPRAVARRDRRLRHDVLRGRGGRPHRRRDARVLLGAAQVHRSRAASCRPGRTVVAVRVFDHYGNGGFTGAAAELRLARKDGEGAALPLAGAWDYRGRAAGRAARPRLRVAAALPDARGPEQPDRAVRRDDRARHAARDPRCHLVPGRVERERRLPVPHALPDDDPRLAPRVGPRRLPLPLRAARELHGPREGAGRERVGRAARGAGEDAGACRTRAWPWRSTSARATTSTRRTRRTSASASRAGPSPTRTASRSRRAARCTRPPPSRARRYACGSPTPRACRRATARRRARFAIAGADRKWRWADGRIDGETVVVSAPDVPQPAAVRYGWADNPDATLRNGDGLPASPFRTDDWPMLTGPRGEAK